MASELKLLFPHTSSCICGALVSDRPVSQVKTPAFVHHREACAGGTRTSMSDFEIFGAFAGAIGLLNLSRQFLSSGIKVARDYREAGKRLTDLEQRLEIFNIRLEYWALSWDVCENTPNRWFIAYWGQRGWRSIGKQLAYIDQLCQDCARTLSEVIGPHDFALLDEKSRRVAQQIDITCKDKVNQP